MPPATDDGLTETPDNVGTVALTVTVALLVIAPKVALMELVIGFGRETVDTVNVAVV